MSAEIDDCLVALPRIEDSRGNLTFVEDQSQIPFSIARVYYLYDVPGGAVRAGHAHRSLWQLVLPVSGSFDIHLDNGSRKRSHFLNSPSQGVLVGPGVWRVIDNFSSGAVCLVLASLPYDEEDYYREYSDFLESVK